MGRSFLIRLAALCLVLNGCAGTQYEKITPKYEYEFESIEDGAINAVNAAETDFFVPFYEDTASWDRAKIFFLQYLKVNSLRDVLQSGSKAAILSNSGMKGAAYAYEIKKEEFGNGFNYSVNCKPQGAGATRLQATKNAKNVARFIREGTLETSLLK